MQQVPLLGLLQLLPRRVERNDTNRTNSASASATEDTEAFSETGTMDEKVFAPRHGVSCGRTRDIEGSGIGKLVFSAITSREIKRRRYVRFCSRWFFASSVLKATNS